MAGLGLGLPTRGGPRIQVTPHHSPKPTSRSTWLPQWRPSHAYSPVPASSANVAGPKTSRRRMIQIGCIALVVIAAIGAIRSRDTSLQTGHATHVEGNVEAESEEDPALSMWGWHEDMGWEPAAELGLLDLGDFAEQRYRLGFERGPAGIEHYYRLLYDFASTLSQELAGPILTSLYDHLPPSHPKLLTSPEAHLGPPSMISYKTIHQTDKSNDQLTSESKDWIKHNSLDGWRLNFLDDKLAWEWVQEKFAKTDVEWAWQYMHRGVLRADFLRYLLPLVEGGVYSDVDTRPIRPIEEWGRVDVEYLDISLTDGDDWRTKIPTHPAVIVAIDVNVHAKLNWASGGWPRALGICQWTLSSAPNHPIMLDAVRRVVNSTRVVEQWENDRKVEIERIEAEGADGWQKQVEALRRQGRDHALNVMEWTGPGLFSDAVLAFLLARYNVTWHRLRGLNHPLRVGDVLILPITAFSPGGEKDFRSGSPDSPQANVLHNFRGSWKGEGA